MDVTQTVMYIFGTFSLFFRLLRIIIIKIKKLVKATVFILVHLVKFLSTAHTDSLSVTVSMVAQASEKKQNGKEGWLCSGGFSGADCAKDTFMK